MASVALMRHIWISNRAFARLTGITASCMECGAPVRKGERKPTTPCPGKTDRTNPTPERAQ